MRAIEFQSPGRAALVAAPAADPGPRELLIETDITLVSTGSERTMLLHAPHYPITPGYSVVGRVAGVGSSVRGFAVGDRVVASAAHASHITCDYRFVLPVPQSVASEDAVFFNIGAMAIHAVRLCELALGDPLLVLGQGLIGLVTTQVARIAGAMPVVGVDLDPNRVELSRRLGADRSFCADEQDQLYAFLRGLPGGGPAGVIELTGSADPVRRAIEVARRGARIVAASVVPGGHDIDLYGRAWLEGMKLVGSYFNARPWCLEQTEATSPFDWPIKVFDGGYYDGNKISTSLGDMALFLRLLELGRVDVSALRNETVTAEEAPAMFERLPKSQSLGVLIRWK